MGMGWYIQKTLFNFFIFFFPISVTFYNNYIYTYTLTMAWSKYDNQQGLHVVVVFFNDNQFKYKNFSFLSSKM